MSAAGVFLIQRLEGSRFGSSTLWVLNGRAAGEGWDKRELISAGPGKVASREEFSERRGKDAGEAGTPVTMVCGHALES
jgi:hypothetical protein